MIVAGVVDGVRHVAVDRLGGDDVTAILAGVAGVALVVPRRGSCCGARAGSTSGRCGATCGGRSSAPSRRSRVVFVVMPVGVRDRRQPQGARAGGARSTSGGRTSTCR